MTLPLIAVLAGLLLLVWSANRFVAAAAAVASHLGMPALLIGMLVVGFGTSAPEMVISAVAALEGNPAIALGNAYGSNISNIALILGVTALICPIAVQSQVLRKELPLLAGVTVIAAIQLLDGQITRTDAGVLLGVFVLIMGWSIWQGFRGKGDHLSEDVTESLDADHLGLGASLFWLVAGLLVLVLSSRLLVWGAIEIARLYGVSDLVIGLTIIAIGTSLPELASSIIAARRNEHDLALGAILGSNLLNTLVVVGIAGSIAPMQVPAEVLTRDMLVMGGLTLALFAMGIGLRGPGRITRVEGAILLATYLAYTTYLLMTTLGG